MRGYFLFSTDINPFDENNNMIQRVFIRCGRTLLLRTLVITSPLIG
jgi:hypothetical protein